MGPRGVLARSGRTVKAGADRTAGEARLRRACCTLGTGLLLAAIGLPATLLAGLPANASVSLASQPSSAPLSVVITGIGPQQWAGPASTVTVTGRVTNESKQAISQLSVQLQASDQPIVSVPLLEQDADSHFAVAGNPLPGVKHGPAGDLAPGASSTWSITFKAKRVGMTVFGAYPISAVASADVGSLPTSVAANTFLPYEPKHRTHSHSRPVTQQIAWIWPLIDNPLTALPGKLGCLLPQTRSLEASMTSGRIATLLTAGSAFAKADRLTWAVDPALLADAKSLSECAGKPSVARPAAAWLTKVRAATAGQQLFVTSYGNVDLALMRNHSGDVNNAYQYGRQKAVQILRRPIPPSAAWPPEGVASYPIVEQLAAASGDPANGIRMVLLDSSKVDLGPGTVFEGSNGVGSSTRVLLYSSALTNTLSASSTGHGSEFETAQQFLAETAVMAATARHSPIIAAPPQRWQPQGNLARSVLAETAKAPWLATTTMSYLAAHAKSTDLGQLKASAGKPFGPRVLRLLSNVDNDVRQLQDLFKVPDPDLYLATAALESSAWHALPRRQQVASLIALRNDLATLQQNVRIITPLRVTLGGLKGKVPVVIDNRLGHAVTVELMQQFTPPPGGGLQIKQDPGGMITVPARKEETTTLHVDATQVGSTTIRLWLANRHGHPLPSPAVRVTVQATQFGNLAMIVLAGGLGVFMVGSAYRAIRRGRPAPPDNADNAGQGAVDPAHGDQQAPAADTVDPERSELGRAGTPGV
jgi:hypothetical protein